MAETLIRLLVAWLVVFPIVTLLHELGHSFVGLIVVKDRPITCMLGTDLNKAQLTLTISPHFRILLSLGTGFFGRSIIGGSGPFSKFQTISISLAGPIVSLIIGVTFFFLPAPENDYLNQLRLLFVTCATLQLLFTIVPVRYPQWFGGYSGRLSDGLRVWLALRRDSAEQKKDPSNEGPVSF
jgi:hypothetical protein